MMGGLGIGMLLVWLLPILLIAWAVKWFLDKDGKRRPDMEDPLELLRRRYAQGEISRDEFEDIQTTLLRQSQ